MKAVQTYGRINTPIKIRKEIIIGKYIGKDDGHVRINVVDPRSDPEEYGIIEVGLNPEDLGKINRSIYHVEINGDRIIFTDNNGNTQSCYYVSISLINDIKDDINNINGDINNIRGDITSIDNRVKKLEAKPDHEPIPEEYIITKCSL